MRNTLLLLALFLASASAWGQSATTQQPSPTTQVHWQARMNDSTTISLRTVYGADFRVASATVVRRGLLRRVAVQCRNVSCRVESRSPLSLAFTCDFEFEGVRYRLRGRYADDEQGGSQSIRCIPLMLGDDLLEQGGWQR